MISVQHPTRPITGCINREIFFLSLIPAFPRLAF